jgi:hypothetical protein
VKGLAARRAVPRRAFLPIRVVDGVHPGDDGMAGTCTTLANPWLDLPAAPPYVLAEDAAAIAAFNRIVPPSKRYDLELLPEPFLGRPDAPVVVLGLNPGWSPEGPIGHKVPKFIQRTRENLRHAETTFPFHLLDPALQGPGYRWWGNKLRRPIEEVGLETVANRVLCVEYFPYHSDKFSGRTPSVPSQQYSFSLVRDAIERDAVIVVMRSLARWLAAVPELASYPRRFGLRSVQNVTISPKNCPDGYSAVIDALRSGGSDLEQRT